jgi:2-polyprenyl-3-methyl-5-hydroxy-6-metoxy-1,4-benzoquinol methylase
MTNVVESYGWGTSVAPESCNYIEPGVLRILADLNVKRVCDLGAGNGALASSIHKAGYSL